MKTAASDLLKQAYDIMLVNDPGQPILNTMADLLKTLGYNDVADPVANRAYLTRPYREGVIADGMRRMPVAPRVEPLSIDLLA